MSEAPILYAADKYDDLIAELKRQGVTHVHVTNGSFEHSDPKVWAEMPVTTAAGFQYVADTTVGRTFRERVRSIIPEMLRKHVPKVRHAFIIAVHGKDGMTEAYNANPEEVHPNMVRAARVVPGVRRHFESQEIPVYGAVFAPLSAIPLEDALHKAGFKLGKAYKFGSWGNDNGKFAVFHKAFNGTVLGRAFSPIFAGSGVLNFPYANQDKKPYMHDKGPWDGTGSDPRDPFREQEGVAFYHAQPGNDPQTCALQIVDLYSENNPAGKQYLNLDNTSGKDFDYQGNEPLPPAV